VHPDRRIRRHTFHGTVARAVRPEQLGFDWSWVAEYHGATFEPRARRPASLLARHLRTSAYEPPGQLRYTHPDYLRGGRRFQQYLRSALADRPEERIGSIPVPVHVARGRNDHYSSQQWVEDLADAAPQGRARTLPGAHAVPYSHPGSGRPAHRRGLRHPTCCLTRRRCRPVTASQDGCT
jgi:pimeloyl-ACP methyl ester carboxylesterase